MNLRQEILKLNQDRVRLNRREDLLCAIEALDRRYTTRLALSDEYRIVPSISAHWKRQAEMSHRAGKRLYHIYQNT